jgi:hypothetical protein
LSENGQAVARPSAAADVSRQQQIGDDVALDSPTPNTHLPRTRPQPRRLNRPPTNGLPAGQADGASAEEPQSGSGSAGPESSPNGEVSNLDTLIKP